MEKRPSGAKARCLCAFRGTTKAVPFQNWIYAISSRLQLRFSSASIYQALRRAGGLAVSAVCSTARAEKSAVTKGVSARRAAAGLPQTATQACTIPRQGLQRIATWFVRQRDNLNRPAAKGTARKLKKYD
jgi:hypothetical protein